MFTLVNIALAAIAATLPVCVEESAEGTNCVWYADAAGNQQGESFISVDNTVYYFKES